MDISQYYSILLVIASNVMICLLLLHTYRAVEMYKKRRYELWSRYILITIFVFSVLGIASHNYLEVDIGNGWFNDSNFIVMISSFLGGPMASIPVAIIVGLEGYLMEGIGIIYLVGTLLSAIIGSALWYASDKKFPSTIHATVIMFLVVMIQMVVSSCMSDNMYASIDENGPALIIGDTICMAITAYCYSIMNRGSD